MNFGSVITQDCVNVPPPIDARCSDPAFAIRNPDVCPVAPALTLKPSVALACILGSVQFRAFVMRHGAEEDVTADTIFGSSDANVALIGATSGNATGMGTGSATITAVYQEMTASGNLTVLTGDCDGGGGGGGTDTGYCAQRTVAMMVMVDTSRSMSLQFGNGYGTRLDFAKAAAVRFVGEVNAQKDLVGLMRFNKDDAAVLFDPQTPSTPISAAAAAIQQTTQLTTFYAGLSAAIASLNSVTADSRVIVLISDGEDTDESYSDTDNPISLLADFKNAGGIVICLGCRAHGLGFDLLASFATGGFFINGVPSDPAQALDYLSGLKGYICAGNCTPDGDVLTATGQLDYTGFANWDVLDGHVDLIGNGLLDLLPGNGLYVDLAGSSVPYNGMLRSKVAYTLEAGKTYRLSVQLAGNQRVNATPESATIVVYSSERDFLRQTILINDYTQGFQSYSFSFTAPETADVYIAIGQAAAPADYPNAGILLNNVSFRNQSDSIDLLSDTFDDENQVYVPPRCGTGTVWTWLADLNQYGYAVGYNCYGTGCLDSPPGVQLPDPNPLGDIETGYKPPHTFSSTKTACATCPAGTANASEQNLVPVMTGPNTPEGEASSSGANTLSAWEVFDDLKMTFWLAPGVPAWLEYRFASARIVTAYEITGDRGAPTAWTFQGSTDRSTWVDLDLRNATWPASVYPNLTTRRFAFQNATAYLYYRVYVTGLATNSSGAIIYQLAMFGAVPTQICATANATSEVSQPDADAKANDAALAIAQAQLHCVAAFSATEQYTAKCGVDYLLGTFGADVTRSATATSFVSPQDAIDQATAAAKATAIAALDCGLSNNDQPILTPLGYDNQPHNFAASQFPSVLHVTETGPIASITVTLKQVNLTTGWFELMLLGPTGIKVLLWGHAGPTQITSSATITIADGAQAMQTGVPLVTGESYAPNNATTQPIVTVPAAMPAAPYQFDLSAFAGSERAGGWSLWLAYNNQGSGKGLLAGWDLTIT